MSITRRALLCRLLLWGTLFCSVFPYLLLYSGRHNSLYDDAAFVSLLLGLTLLYPRAFRRFVRARSRLNGFALAVAVLLVVDLAVNAPLNLYKTKMYTLLAAMYLLTFFFARLEAGWKTRFVVSVLLAWLAVSLTELSLRWTRPDLFAVFPWNSMSLQSALAPLVKSGALTIVESKVYGLGIGSQANIIALFALLILVRRHALREMPAAFRRRAGRAVITGATLVLLPFSLSLTAIMALVCALLASRVKRIRLTMAAKLTLAAGGGAAIALFAFDIGAALSFAASRETRDAYLHELVGWPIAFLAANMERIALGLQNDLAGAPLENRYFNVLLTLGLPLFAYIVVWLFRLLVKLMRRSGDEARTRLMLYVLIGVAYAHIGFAAHAPGLILLAILFIYATDPVPHAVQSTGPAPVHV